MNVNDPRILVVEDERDMAALLEVRLCEVAGSVVTARDARSASRLCETESFSLIVLDLMLPDGSGTDICRQLRSRDDHTPVLMLTARSSEHDKITGFDSGADDYVTKPFSIEELLCRARALMRRSEQWRTTAAISPTIIAGPLAIDVPKRRVHKGEESLALTAKEFDLLLLLAQSPGKVFSRRDLLKLVWGYQHEGYRHTIDTHVSRLRNKIEDNPADPALIETVWGVGYRFAENCTGV